MNLDDDGDVEDLVCMNYLIVSIVDDAPNKAHQQHLYMYKDIQYSVIATMATSTWAMRLNTTILTSSRLRVT
jgi:hypothetical protein